MRKPDHETLSALCRLASGALDVAVLGARANGIPFNLAVGDKQRLKLLASLAADDAEPLELELDIRAFRQVDGEPNRNFIRFKKKILRKMARSFKGVPFQKDHDTSVDARIGTVTASKAVEIEGGLAFDMTALVTEPSAVLQVLRMNIDRFSIAVNPPPLDTLECSACGTAVFTDCSHFPGDALEDGGRVEFVLTEAEGVELSAVSVPAVVGTELQEIRSALSRAAGSRLFTSRDTNAEDTSMKTIATALKLSTEADESTIVVAIGALTARAQSAEASLANEQQSHAETRGDVEELKARVVALSAADVVRSVDALCVEFAGKFAVTRNPEGVVCKSPFELEIRKLAAKDLEGARTMLAAVPDQGPAIGQVPAVLTAVPGTSATPIAPVARFVGDGSSEVARNQRGQLGMSEEEFAKFNPHTGTETGYLRN